MSKNYYTNKGAGHVTLSPLRAIHYFDSLAEIAEARGGELAILHPSRKVVHVPGRCVVASVDDRDVAFNPNVLRDAVLLHYGMDESDADFKITAGSNGTVYINGEKYRTFIMRKANAVVCGELVEVVTHESFFDYVTARNLAGY